MKPLCRLSLLLFATFLGCADGGPVGTGISSSSVSGMVVAVDTTAGGGAASLAAPVRVSLVESPNIATSTDSSGNFDLVGQFSGSVTLKFDAPQAQATTPLEVPLAAQIDLGQVRLRPGFVSFNKPQVRRFFGQVALVDCSPTVPGAAEILVNDQKMMANQFMVRVTPATVIVTADGQDVQCGQIQKGEHVAIEGVMQSDRTIGAITLTVSPPNPDQPQPVLQLDFAGTVAGVNCGSGMIQLSNDRGGQLRLRLSEDSGLVNPALQPLQCSDIQAGDHLEGTGLVKAHHADAIQVVTAVVRPQT